MVRIGQKLSPPKVVSRILGVARFNIRLLRKEKAPATAALSESGRVGLMTDREKPRRGVWSKGVAASYSEKLTDGSKEGSKHAKGGGVRTRTLRSEWWSQNLQRATGPRVVTALRSFRTYVA